LCVQVGGALAIEAVKLLTGIGEPLLGRILLIDALTARVREVPLRPSGQSPMRPADPLPEVAEIDVAEFDARRAAGVAVLDVREPEETELGTVPGARLVPLAAVLDDPAALGTGPYAVVCKAGMRAHRAARALAAAGADVVVLSGGMDAWTGGRA
jgi:adenylyltransferase/sulfurtransferase